MKNSWRFYGLLFFYKPKQQQVLGTHNVDRQDAHFYLLDEHYLQCPLGKPYSQNRAFAGAGGRAANATGTARVFLVLLP